MCARTVGDYFNEGVYELGMELKNLPYLDHHVHQKYDLAKIGHFCSRNVITLGMISKVEEVAAVLNGCNHHGFPVVDNFGKYVGMVRRDQLAALIECGIFVEELEELDIEQDRDIDIHMDIDLEIGDIHTHRHRHIHRHRHRHRHKHRPRHRHRHRH